MSILDKPLTVIFPELNSLQIGMIRELMKREYERGGKETLQEIMALGPLSEEAAGEAFKKLRQFTKFTISEPTTTQYTAKPFIDCSAVDKEKT